MYFTCNTQVKLVRLHNVMPKKMPVPRRSDCPINICLELFGDRWSLLIVRDLLFKKQHEFKDYLAAKEKIATNILSSRLKWLEQTGIITRATHPTDARKAVYRLTQKGLDLAPLLVEMVVWAERHEKGAATPAVVRRLIADKEAFLAELVESNGAPAPPKRRSGSSARK